MSNLNIPGKQIILYGHSGSGKTTLIRKMLKDNKIKYILVHCTSLTTINDIILEAFDQLNIYYVSEKKLSNLNSITSSLKAEYKSIAADISISKDSSHSETMIRLLPPRLTRQKLAEFLGELQAVLIIEDFHKVKGEEKKGIADMLKIFIDAANKVKKVKIICIGAVLSARDLLDFDPDLHPRITEIEVPLLTESEIKSIVNKGCNLLNILMSDELIGNIAYYSNRLASLTHQMCYDICFSNKILKKQCKYTKIDDDSFKCAIKAHTDRNSDTLKRIYDSCVQRQLAWYILKTIVTVGKNDVKFEEIKKGVCQNNRSFSDEEIIEELGKLSSTDVNIIIYDNKLGNYSISTPFWGAFLKMQNSIEDTNRKNKKQKKIGKIKSKSKISNMNKHTDTDIVSTIIYEMLKEIINENKNK